VHQQISGAAACEFIEGAVYAVLRAKLAVHMGLPHTHFPLHSCCYAVDCKLSFLPCLLQGCKQREGMIGILTNSTYGTMMTPQLIPVLLGVTSM
jgi:hypothetical protein